MKKNKLTKLALALGTAATIAAPIAAVVSCGSIGGTLERYNTSEGGEVVLQTTFSSTGPQFQALNDLVNLYNADEANKKKPGFKKVKLVKVEGGYGTIAPALKMKFMAKTDEIPNMFIDYADAAGQIAFDGMSLDLTGTEGQLDKDIYGPMNKGLAYSEDKTLILPIAQSAEMITVDAPLIAFLINAAGGTLSTTAGSYTNKIAAAAGSDFGTNQNGWKSDSAAKDVNLGEVTDADFQSYEALFALSDKLAKSQGLSPASTRRILGLDSAVNASYEIAASNTGNDTSKFIYTKDSVNGYVNYDLFNKDSTTATFKNSITPIINAVNNHSTRIYGGGAYGSSDETHHQLAMGIGSTAGYSHDFISVKVGEDKLPSIDGKIGIKDIKAGLLTADAKKDDELKNKRLFKNKKTGDLDPNGNAELTQDQIDEDAKLPEKDQKYKDASVGDKIISKAQYDTDRKLDTRQFAYVHVGDVYFVDGSHTNQIVVGGTNNYNFKVDAASMAAVKTFLGKNKANVYLSKGKDAPTGMDKTKPDTYQELKNSEGETNGYLVVASDTVSKNATTLQEDELVAMPSPSSNKRGGAKTSFLQGPGLIGVHNNEAEDVATKLFASWFTSANTTVSIADFKGKTTKPYNSPLQAWSHVSEYVVATKPADTQIILGGIDNFDAGDQYTKANYFVTQKLKEIDAHNEQFLSPPADEISGDLRTNFQSKLGAAYDTYHGGDTISVDDIYGDLRRSARVAGFF